MSCSLKSLSINIFKDCVEFPKWGFLIWYIPGLIIPDFIMHLGCLHLMQKAVRVLGLKGVEISAEEEEALQIAILLHDIGHGPFLSCHGAQHC